MTDQATLTGLLDQLATCAANAPALIYGNTVTTYANLSTQSVTGQHSSLSQKDFAMFTVAAAAMPKNRNVRVFQRVAP